MLIRRLQGVINATGPFSDGIRKLDEPTTKEIVAPSAGVHITLPVSDLSSAAPPSWCETDVASDDHAPQNYYGPKTMGLLDPATSDGRVIFFLPRTRSRPRRRSSGSSTRSATTSPPTSRSEGVMSSRLGQVSVRSSVTQRPRTRRVWSGTT
jgi:hypothetical protein